MISKELLLKIGKSKGLANKGHIEKDYFQDLFLSELYNHSNKFIFKGGTCLYKLFDLPRFSEDLDFSILEKIDTKNIVKISEKIGANVKNIRETRDSILIKLVFKGIVTSSNTLRIDINTKNIPFNYEVKHFISPYIDINPFSIRVLDLKEILAEKIHSILSRERARDLYDLFFILRFVKPEREIIDKKLEIFDMKFNFLEFKKKVNKLKTVWIYELKPFLLTEPIEFKIAKDFVIEKLKNI